MVSPWKLYERCFYTWKLPLQMSCQAGLLYGNHCVFTDKNIYTSMSLSLKKPRALF